MKIISRVSELEIFLSKTSKDKSLGFVPTMGALHPGHISLVEKAISQNDISLCSIFVNPAQFNDTGDLDKYPNQLDADLKLLEKTGCDIVFTPSKTEIYPEGFTAKSYDFGNLDKVMEGETRPGHFEGVALVVSRLFDIVQPQKAYFGEKDFQQLAIIRLLASQNYKNIEIVPCPILREADGLAMSSRNLLLDEKYRSAAPRIHKRLLHVKKHANTKSVSELKQWIVQEFKQDPDLKLEYFEISDADGLQSSTQWSDHQVHIACIACFAGSVRLIDNILLELN
jgi:pantoate--beta-alanine ligase